MCWDLWDYLRARRPPLSFFSCRQWVGTQLSACCAMGSGGEGALCLSEQEASTAPGTLAGRAAAAVRQHELSRCVAARTTASPGH